MGRNNRGGEKNGCSLSCALQVSTSRCTILRASHRVRTEWCDELGTQYLLGQNTCTWPKSVLLALDHPFICPSSLDIATYRTVFALPKARFSSSLLFSFNDFGGHGSSFPSVARVCHHRRQVCSGVC